MAHEGANTFVFQNIVGNIVLFIPLGFLLPILIPAYNSVQKIMLLGFCLSFSFEFIQLITVLGIFDIDDTMLNTLGCLIGFFAFKYFVADKNVGQNFN